MGITTYILLLATLPPVGVTIPPPPFHHYALFDYKKDGNK